MAVMESGFKPMWGVRDAKVFFLAGKWAIGASGAVGAQTGGKGMSLTRTAAGKYTVQLVTSSGDDSRCNAILHADAKLIVADYDPTDDTDAHWTKMYSVTDADGTVLFACVDEGGVVREAPSGAVISVLVIGRFSSAN